MELKFTEDILPVTDFRNNAAEVLAQLEKNRRPMLLTQRGRATAVLLDVREYQRLLDRIRQLESGTPGHIDAAGSSASPSIVSRSASDDSSLSSDLDLVRELEKWIQTDI